MENDSKKTSVDLINISGFKKLIEDQPELLKKVLYHLGMQNFSGKTFVTLTNISWLKELMKKELMKGETELLKEILDYHSRMQNFSGKTFVAITDISGFKKLMKDGPKVVRKVLDHFYQQGYEILKTSENVSGIFISDCGILFSRYGDNTTKLENLLKVIKEINKAMLEEEYMLTTSIAYGYFKYEDRITISRIAKNMLYGDAYVDAFLDNEKNTPKIQPGQCRLLVNDNIPPDLDIENIEGIKRLLKKRKRNKQHYYYYYWTLKNPKYIKEFEKAYKESFSSKYSENLKYQRILQVLNKDYTEN